MLIQFETMESWAFSWNDVTATVLKVWSHVWNPTPSVDAYLLEEQSCQISPDL